VRRLALVGWDSAAWLIGLSSALWLRYEGGLAGVDTTGAGVVLVVAVLAHWAAAVPLQVYRGRYEAGSLDEAIGVAAVVVLAGGATLVLVLSRTVPPVPRSVPLTATLIAMALALSLRVLIRQGRERLRRRRSGSARRVIVLGSGPQGQNLVRSMTADTGSGYLPVALLDDDPHHRHRRCGRVAVQGTRHDIAVVAARSRADLLVVASRDLDAAMMHEVHQTAGAAGLGVKVLPPLSEVLRPCAELASLPGLDITDLLGRRPVRIDPATIAAALSGKRVLVTGAGGSIGSELCRQIHRAGPLELMMLDRDESALHATQLSIRGSALLDSSDVLLADIRDRETLTALFLERRPDVVFHAAALKHLPLLEQYPDEAWKTNVVGTQNVLDAAWYGGTRMFVNISTDKAANPTSVLGRSKRIGERLVADAATYVDGTYLSVRFGNVLGSRGSVLTSFTEQLASGGPITVTHPDVTRFFMTIPEATQLVVHAAAIGRPGEALVLDMGDPVRIEDLARQLMRIAGRTVRIVHTGLRQGEKLHEELFGDGERDVRPIHPAVSHVAVPPLSAAVVLGRCALVGAARAMVELVDAPVPARASVGLLHGRREVS
jgi:FlaA1/EpsC-like NDP-sugar epimerase